MIKVAPDRSQEDDVLAEHPTTLVAMGPPPVPNVYPT